MLRTKATSPAELKITLVSHQPPLSFPPGIIGVSTVPNHQLVDIFLIRFQHSPHSHSHKTSLPWYNTRLLVHSKLQTGQYYSSPNIMRAYSISLNAYIPKPPKNSTTLSPGTIPPATYIITINHSYIIPVIFTTHRTTTVSPSFSILVLMSTLFDGSVVLVIDSPNILP